MFVRSVCFVFLTLLSLTINAAEVRTYFISQSFQSVVVYEGLHKYPPKDTFAVSEYAGSENVLDVLTSLKGQSAENYKIFIEVSSVARARQVSCAGIEGAKVACSGISRNVEIDLERALKLVKKVSSSAGQMQQNAGLLYVIGNFFKKKNKSN